MIVYFVELMIFFGPQVMQLVPVTLTILILLLTVAFTIFGAALASVISSRVNTFQSAQTYGALISIVLWMGFFVLIFTASSWGLWIFALAVAAIWLLDAVLIYFGAITWQREEVMAKQ